MVVGIPQFQELYLHKFRYFRTADIPDVHDNLCLNPSRPGKKALSSALWLATLTTLPID
jgi:hypothetical protein